MRDRVLAPTNPRRAVVAVVALFDINALLPFDLVKVGLNSTPVSVLPVTFSATSLRVYGKLAAWSDGLLIVVIPNSFAKSTPLLTARSSISKSACTV